MKAPFCCHLERNITFITMLVESSVKRALGGGKIIAKSRCFKKYN